MSLCYPSLLPFISPISISRQPWQYNFFSIIILRFIYVVACTNCSLLFIVIYYPFYGYAPVCLSTYLSIGIRIISRFWLLLNIFSWAIQILGHFWLGCFSLQSLTVLYILWMHILYQTFASQNCSYILFIFLIVSFK